MSDFTLDHIYDKCNQYTWSHIEDTRGQFTTYSAGFWDLCDHEHSFRTTRLHGWGTNNNNKNKFNLMSRFDTLGNINDTRRSFITRVTLNAVRDRF